MNKTLSDRNIAKNIKKLYADDENATAILDYFAKGKKSMSVSYVHRVAYKTDVATSEAVRVLKELADIGCGRFVVGRHGKKSRLVWFYSLISVGQVARGEAEDFEELESEIDDDEILNLEELEDGDDTGDLTSHSFQLRPDLIVRFSLPTDITSREADRIAAFVKTLPFE